MQNQFSKPSVETARSIQTLRLPSCPVPNRNHLNGPLFVHDPIVYEIRQDEHDPSFAALALHLFCNPVAMWEFLQAVKGINQFLDHGSSVLLGILCNVFVDGVDVGGCAGRDDEMIAGCHVMRSLAEIGGSQFFPHLFPWPSLASIKLCHPFFDGCERLGVRLLGHHAGQGFFQHFLVRMKAPGLDLIVDELAEFRFGKFKVHEGSLSGYPTCVIAWASSPSHTCCEYADLWHVACGMALGVRGMLTRRFRRACDVDDIPDR